jgi:hypothetical protein
VGFTNEKIFYIIIVVDSTVVDSTGGGNGNEISGIGRNVFGDHFGLKEGKSLRTLHRRGGAAQIFPPERIPRGQSVATEGISFDRQKRGVDVDERGGREGENRL